MLKLIDPGSSKTILPELDLHSIPPSQVGVLATRTVQIPLKNSLLPNGPWEFQIASNSKAFLNLKKTWIYVTFKILNEDGSVLPLKDEDGNENFLYAPCQGFAASLVRQFTLHINSQLVYDSTVNHAYKSYIENMLTFGKDRKETNLEAMGYSYETEINKEASSTFKARAKLTQAGQVCQLAAPISIDLFNQERLLLNYCDVRLVAYPNSHDFLIDAYGTAAGAAMKVEISDVFLQTEEWDLTDGFSMAVEKRLSQSKIHYPLNSVQMRSFFIQEGRMDSPVNTIFTTHTPKRVIVCMVDGESFNGSTTKSPFNFAHFNLQNIYLDFNGRTVPTRPMALDYDNNKYMTAYVQMLEGLGLARNAGNNGITPEMFKSFLNFYVFEISPTVNSASGVMEMLRQSNLSVRIEFKKPVPSGGIYAVVLGEFDTLLSFDANRNVYFDSVN